MLHYIGIFPVYLHVEIKTAITCTYNMLGIFFTPQKLFLTMEIPIDTSVYQ